VPRSLWNGAIAIGPVPVPVKLYSATEDKAVKFMEVHVADAAKVRHERRCTADGAEVPSEEVVKGYEVAPGEFVVLTKDEVKAAAGTRGKVIDVEHFVPADQLDPVWFAKPYVLGAQDAGGDAFRALHDALERTGRVAVGRWTFHDRERLVAIGVRDGLLALHVLRFADEVVQPGDVELEQPKKAPGDREVDMAGRLVDSLHKQFSLDDLADEHRVKVLELIEAKAKGEAAPQRDEEEPEETDDLLAALEASLAGARA
jgi:DNA end-binding protein Ku